MNLSMEVYSVNPLTLQGIIEEFDSIEWTEYAFKAGSFKLNAALTATNKTLLVEGNILRFEGETAGIIEYIHEETYEGSANIEVGGHLLIWMAENRILWGMYNLYDYPPSIMHYLAVDCMISPSRGVDSLDKAKRQYPDLIDDIDYTTVLYDKIRKQKTGDSCLQVLSEIGSTNLTAFGIRLNPSAPRMEFWTRESTNRSIHQQTNTPVHYSTELDDVLESTYDYNSTESKNIVLIAAAGNEPDRVYATVMDGELIDFHYTGTWPPNGT